MVLRSWKVPGGLLLASTLLLGCGSPGEEASLGAGTSPGVAGEAPEGAPGPGAPAEVAEAAAPAGQEPPAAAAPARSAPRTGPLPPELPRTGVVPEPVVELQEEAPQDLLLLPAGTQVVLALDRPLSTRTHVRGDLFFARVAEDILGEGGVVLVPEGTRVRGVVRESARSSAPDELPVLELEVEQLLLPGVDLPLQAEIVSIAPEAEAGDSRTESAAKVGAGAAAGALLGRILGGDRRGAVKGAIAGAVAGGVVAYITRDGHAELREGSLLVIRVLEPLPLPPPF